MGYYKKFFCNVVISPAGGYKFFRNTPPLGGAKKNPRIINREGLNVNEYMIDERVLICLVTYSCI